MKYRTCDDRFRHFSEPGSMIEKTYEGYYDLDGVLQLKETGEHNIYLDTQADADACDINLLIARYMAGDESALNRVKGYYADISNLPTNIHDVYNIIKRAERDFEALPVEVKERFDNTFEKFLFTAGTSDWHDRTGIEEPVKEEEKEVKSDAE